MKTELIRSLCRRCGLRPSSRRAPPLVRCRHILPVACVSVTPTNGRTISLLPSPNCHPFHYGVSRSSQLVRSVVRKHKTLVRNASAHAKNHGVCHTRCFTLQSGSLLFLRWRTLLTHLLSFTDSCQGTFPNKSVSASEEAFSQERTYRDQLLMKFALGAEDFGAPFCDLLRRVCTRASFA